MAIPMHKMMKSNGVITRQHSHHNAQQRVPHPKMQGNPQQAQLRFQAPALQQQQLYGPQLRMHTSQNHHPQRIRSPQNQRLQNPQQMQRLQNSQSQDSKQNEPQFEVPSLNVFTMPSVDVVKDTEKLKNEQEKLGSLHLRIHSEAEKIRHWQSEKEMEMKQKDRSLSDAIHTIANLRKSIIELQFQNEEFSTSLHEKEIEKEETEQKLNTVREMANVLRQKMVELEDRIGLGEQDKEVINESYQKLLEEYQGLSLKFQELDISQSTLVEKHSHKIQSIERKFEAESSEMHSNIQCLENEVINFMKTVKKQQEDIAEVDKIMVKLKTDLALNQEKLQDAEEKLLLQEETLEKRKSLFEDINGKYIMSCQTLISTREELVDSKRKNSELGGHIMELEKIHLKERTCLEEDVKSISEKLNESRGEIKLLSEECEKKVQLNNELKDENGKERIITETIKSELMALHEVVKELRKEKDGISIKLIECENILNTAKCQLSTQVEVNHDLEGQIKSLSISQNSLLTEKESLTGEVKNLNIKIELIEESSAQSCAMITNLKEELSICRQTLDEKLNEMRSLETVRNDLEGKLLEEQEAVRVKSGEIMEKQQMMDKKDVANEEMMNKLEIANGEIKDLKDKVSELETKLSLLSEKENENASMKTELVDIEKKSEDLGNQTKSLQSQINVRSKQVKNLEKENKTLKVQVKRVAEKNLKLEEVIKSAKDAELILNETLTKSGEMLKICQKEIQVMKDNFDVERKNFCNTLEHYKRENDKIVLSYVKENEVTNVKLGEIHTENEKFREKMKKAKCEMDEQRLRIEQLEEEALHILDKNSDDVKLEEILQSTKCELDLKVDENKKLKDEICAIEEKRSEEVENIRLENISMQEKIDCIPKLMEENNFIRKQNMQLQEKLVQPIKEKESECKENEDHLLPTTPKSHQHQSCRAKRELNIGNIENEVNINCSSSQQLAPRTPMLGSQKRKNGTKLKVNKRFSPKPSAELIKMLECDEVEEISPIKKVGTVKRKSANSSSDQSGVGSLLLSYNEVLKDSNQIPKKVNIYGKLSPCIIPKPKRLNTKMKKVAPKLGTRNANLSWFDTDDAFEFGG